MVEAAPHISAAGCAHHDRHRRAAAVAIPQCSRPVDDLIESTRNEIGKLHFGDRPVAAQRGADTDADDGGFRDRRVDHAHLAELIVKPLRRAECATVSADVFTEDEYLRIAAHFFGERLTNRLEVGNFTHTDRSPRLPDWDPANSPQTPPRHQSPISPALRFPSRALQSGSEAL